MRESEEYLYNSEWCTSGETEGYKVIDIDDAEHAVKLAYKEGYLEAIQVAMDALYGYTELASWDVEEILKGVIEEFKKLKQ